MTLPISDPDLLAAWSTYEARNRAANDAYRGRSSFVCRGGCGLDFGSVTGRRNHERSCTPKLRVAS